MSDTKSLPLPPPPPPPHSWETFYKKKRKEILMTSKNEKDVNDLVGGLRGLIERMIDEKLAEISKKIEEKTSVPTLRELHGIIDERIEKRKEISCSLCGKTPKRLNGMFHEGDYHCFEYMVKVIKIDEIKKFKDAERESNEK